MTGIDAFPPGVFLPHSYALYSIITFRRDLENLSSGANLSIEIRLYELWLMIMIRNLTHTVNTKEKYELRRNNYNRELLAAQRELRIQDAALRQLTIQKYVIIMV